MSVSNATNFASSVNSLPALKSGNVYSASAGTPVDAAGRRTPISLTMNGAPYLKNVTHVVNTAGPERMSPTDANGNSGAIVEFGDLANPACLHVCDAAQFLNSLL